MNSQSLRNPYWPQAVEVLKIISLDKGLVYILQVTEECALEPDPKDLRNNNHVETYGDKISFTYGAYVKDKFVIAEGRWVYPWALEARLRVLSTF